mmetsp:Transcript_18514/g.54874  ORF Transcript_18514/g.54874 Transcript_18514/m.54874 type:complete len:364 (-) Transcript_18514:284-1375(-)
MRAASASRAASRTLRSSLRPSLRRYCTETDAILMAAPPRMRVVDLHRPDALNALNSEMVATLLPLFQDWQQVGGDVKLVVMRGAGDRAFCAGGDIRFLHECASGYAATGDPAALSPAHEFFRAEYTLNNVLGTSRVPVVSILGGIVMGGGVGLSVHGQVRIATDSTIFAMPETGIGFFPDVGGSYFLPRLPAHLGFFLGLTGTRLRGRDVLTAGVATHFVPLARIEALEALLLEMAASTSGKAYTLESNQDFVDPEVLARAIGALDEVDRGKADGAPAAAPPLLTLESMGEIDAAFGLPDVGLIVEAVGAGAAAARERGDDTHWSIRAAAELGKVSPTSLAAAHAIFPARDGTLFDALSMPSR